MKTHLYKENVDIIQRGDDTILTAAVEGAIAEAKGYLGAYDIERIFNVEASDRNPLLLIWVKDIATWHFLVLCNAGYELELREQRYKQAIDWLKNVQKGNITPNLPKIEDTKDENASWIKYGSNPQKQQHF